MELEKYRYLSLSLATLYLYCNDSPKYCFQIGRGRLGLIKAEGLGVISPISWDTHQRVSVSKAITLHVNIYEQEFKDLVCPFTTPCYWLAARGISLPKRPVKYEKSIIYARNKDLKVLINGLAVQESALGNLRFPYVVPYLFMNKDKYVVGEVSFTSNAGAAITPWKFKMQYDHCNKSVRVKQDTPDTKYGKSINLLHYFDDFYFNKDSSTTFYLPPEDIFT